MASKIKIPEDSQLGGATLEHDYQDWVHRIINDLNQVRREKVLGFIQELELDGCSKLTVQRYVRAIAKLGTNGKPYEELTRQDLIQWLHELPYLGSGGEKFSEETINAEKRMCKRFLRYCHTGKIHLKDVEDYPEVLECIQYRNPKVKLPKDVLTKSEVRKIVEACQNQRNRAMIFTLYESGCRAGEFLGLKIGDVEFDRYGATILVDGKTGERRIRLVESVPDLQLWINMHPHKDDRSAPVWLSRNGEKESLSKTQFRDLIVQRAEWAGIDKRVYPHLFRHSRATHLANVLTEAQMREFFGWSENSKVPSRYVHLSGRDIDDTLLQHYDIQEVEEEVRDESLKPKSCQRCRFENPVGSRFCNKCGMPLDDESALRIDEKRQEADKIQEMFNKWILENGEGLFKRFIKSPEVQEKLEQIRA